MATATSQLIMVEAAVINRMLRDQRFLDTFPFLRAAATTMNTAPPKPKCGTCGAKNRAVTNQQYEDIKRQIAGLTADQHVQLKTLLGAKQGRVVYRGHDGKTIRRTF